MNKVIFPDQTKRNSLKGFFLMKLNKMNQNNQLNSAEMGKLWAVYMGNTMAVCVLRYFHKHTEDENIKKVVVNALHLSEKIVKGAKDLFIQTNFPIPAGYTEEDVNLDAPRLFSDEFYLHYLKYTSKAGMSIYSIAIPIMNRKDVRDFFIKTFQSTVKLTLDINEVLETKGILTKPPNIPTPEKVDFVKQQNFLNGFFGDIRSLHALEIAHLYDNMENNAASKTLLIGFSQVAQIEKVKEFFLRGKKITMKHLKASSEQLNKNDLPSPPLLDNLVTTSTHPPFSDKLMLWHKIDMFSMKIRTYANDLSLNGRRDLGGMYAKFLMDIGLYVEDGANIMIDHGWMEQPPKAADREDLAKK